jgi:NTE family protein
MELENIAFGGCGVRNAAYAGALMALQEAGLLGALRGVSGTSAGSIIATLVACGYSPAEVRDALLDLDFKRLTNDGFVEGAMNMYESFGLHEASYVETRLDQLITAKTGKKHTTFAELREHGGLVLKVVGTNLSRRMARVFPDERTQDMPIVKAVRISIAIPLFFEAKQLDGDLYVDGGLLWNLPVEAFDPPDSVNPRTLGLLVQERAHPEPWPIDGARSYAMALFATLLRAQDSDLQLSPGDRSRVVTIDDLGISPVHFDITREQKTALIDSGHAATLRFLEARRLAASVASVA